MAKPAPVTLHRYTNLVSAIHILRTRSITLLNPATWDDRNDAYFMAEYKRKSEAKTILALCFAERKESYHHWRVFSGGTDGVRIEFDKEKLLSTFQHDPQTRLGKMAYRKIGYVNRLKSFDIERLPFLKRAPYKDEGEFRVVYVDKARTLEVKDYEIELSWIRRITLSPWIDKALFQSVKEMLHSIDGCSRIQISRSTLIENEQWRRLASSAS
jgi:hypothetical protein